MERLSASRHSQVKVWVQAAAKVKAPSISGHKTFIRLYFKRDDHVERAISLYTNSSKISVSVRLMGRNMWVVLK